MPTVTINGTKVEFEPGISVLQLAIDHGLEIPHYCYHQSLSVPANCRICLAEIWQPNARNDNKLEYLGKLVPTCSTPASDGMVVYTDSPRAIANQKSVMELLLINHPVDCPVCDQAGECHLRTIPTSTVAARADSRKTRTSSPRRISAPTCCCIPTAASCAPVASDSRGKSPVPPS